MKIHVIDDLNPEDLAMLQALYSRSSESVEKHLGKVKSTGSGKFMEQYYVGYSHKSIADCGSTTIFIEGVSMLAAKAIQNNPMYSGQETSTRYIDMGAREIADPIATPGSQAILKRWMAFYVENQDRVSGQVVKRHPKRADEDDKTYAKAIAARTFDIMRGFLPAGITTQLSWHTNLRQAGDQLNWLDAHPLSEVRNIAAAVRAQLHERYPASGFDRNLAALSGVSNKDEEAQLARKTWTAEFGNTYSYQSPALKVDDQIDVIHSTNIQKQQLEQYKELLQTRPKGCVLPNFLADLGTFTFTFKLDFGSFRDLQRHRNGVCRMPRLETGLGFEPWYLSELEGDVYQDALTLLTDQEIAIERLAAAANNKQYLTAMGFQVPCQVTYSLPALVYVLELRSSKTVHPTLRKRIHHMIETFQTYIPDNLVKLHVDRDPNDWDVRRGLQTITEK